VHMLSYHSNTEANVNIVIKQNSQTEYSFWEQDQIPTKQRDDTVQGTQHSLILDHFSIGIFMWGFMFWRESGGLSRTRDIRLEHVICACILSHNKTYYKRKGNSGVGFENGNRSVCISTGFFSSCTFPGSIQ